MSSNPNPNSATATAATATAAFSPRRRQQQWRRQPHHRPKSKPAAAAGKTTGLRKPVFVKVEELKPGTAGHTLVAKVVSSETVLSKGRGGTRVAECVVGDETGTVIFTARNEQVDLLKPGEIVIIRNAKIDMFKGTMRLAVDKWGRIEVTEPATFVVKEDNNLSLVEYELVSVVEE